MSWNVAEGRAQRAGPARLHAERHQQDPRRAVQRPARSRRPGVGSDHWDELDDPELRPDRWTIRTVFDRLREHGDPMAPALTDHQHLPKLQ